MNSSVVTSHSPDSSPAGPVVRAVTFNLDRLNLAIRIDCIHKILRHTLVHSSGLNEMGFTHIADQDVTVVDLHRRLFGIPTPPADSTRVYLILVHTTPGSLLGIPVTTLPTLVDLPLNQIRVLPEVYRQSDTLGIASHVALVDTHGIPQTIFLLDINLLIP